MIIKEKEWLGKIPSNYLHHYTVHTCVFTKAAECFVSFGRGQSYWLSQNDYLLPTNWVGRNIQLEKLHGWYAQCDG